MTKKQFYLLMGGLAIIMGAALRHRYLFRNTRMTKTTNTELLMTLVAETVEKVRYSGILTPDEMALFEIALQDACTQPDRHEVNVYHGQEWRFWDEKEQL